MRNLFSAELYKLKRMRIVWAAALVPILACASLALRKDYLQEPLLIEAPRLNYIGFLCYTPGVRALASMIILAAAYIASRDFEERTVQNVLSKGVNRGSYYFSRFLNQLFFALLVYGEALLAFVLCRLYRQQEQGIFGSVMPAGECAAVLLISYLQLCAHCSVANMLSIFMKKQSTNMMAALAWLLAELISPILESVSPRMAEVTCFVPLIVLERGVNTISSGRVISFAYLRYGLSAVGIICLVSAVGYWKFCCTDQTMIEEEE